MSNVVKEDIQTVIDRLVDYVNANGTVSLKSAAKAVARTPDQVEKFALLLEEAGIIEVKYSLGGIKLSTKSAKPEGASAPQVNAKPKGRKSEVLEETERLGKEVLTSENLLKFFESDIERRIVYSEQLLKDLESREGFTLEELEALRREVDLALKQLDSFSSEIKKMNEREELFYGKLKEFRSRIDHIEAKAEPTVKKRNPFDALLDKVADMVLGLVNSVSGAKRKSVEAKPLAEKPEEPRLVEARPVEARAETKRPVSVDSAKPASTPMARPPIRPSFSVFKPRPPSQPVRPGLPGKKNFSIKRPKRK